MEALRKGVVFLLEIEKDKLEVLVEKEPSLYRTGAAGDYSDAFDTPEDRGIKVREYSRWKVSKKKLENLQEILDELEAEKFSEAFKEEVRDQIE